MTLYSRPPDKLYIFQVLQEPPSLRAVVSVMLYDLPKHIVHTPVFRTCDSVVMSRNELILTLLFTVSTNARPQSFPIRKFYQNLLKGGLLAYLNISPMARVITSPKCTDIRQDTDYQCHPLHGKSHRGDSMLDMSFVRKLAV